MLGAFQTRVDVPSASSSASSVRRFMNSTHSSSLSVASISSSATRCPLFYSTQCYKTRWRKTWYSGKKTKGIRLSDKTEDCLTNPRFADDVLLFSTLLGKLRDMLCDFKASTEAVGLGIHPDRPKILSNQDNVKAKEITVEDIKIETLRKSDSARYLGQKVTFEDQETEGQKQTEGSVGSVPQVSTGADFKRISIVSQTSPFQHGHHSYDDLCKWHMDSHEEARKIDQNSATKDASPHITDEKKVQDKKESFKQQKRWGAR